MALIKCPDCGKEVQDALEWCPACGRNLHKYIGEAETPESTAIEKSQEPKQEETFQETFEDVPNRKGHVAALLLIVSFLGSVIYLLYIAYLLWPVLTNDIPLVVAGGLFTLRLIMPHILCVVGGMVLGLIAERKYSRLLAGLAALSYLMGVIFLPGRWICVVPQAVLCLIACLLMV